MAPFPLIKLGALAVRQVAKPLANRIKSRAKTSKFFRDYICMPPAQMYHYFEVNVKMKLLGLWQTVWRLFCFTFSNLGLEKPTNVKKLNEAAAIELGAELLGEAIIFVVAVGTLTAEYVRQSIKASAEAEKIEEKWLRTETRIQDLEFQCERQRVEIRELTRLIHQNPTRKTIFMKKAPAEIESVAPINPTADIVKPPSQTGIDSAIDEAREKMNIK